MRHAQVSLAIDSIQPGACGTWGVETRSSLYGLTELATFCRLRMNLFSFDRCFESAFHA